MSRRYPNPPVVEALCEVYFQGSKWDSTVPGQFYARVRDRFPKKTEQRQAEIALKVGDPDVAMSTRQREPRVQFANEEESRMVQVTRNLIVVNQLRPYPQFEEWRPEVVYALSLYGELADPDAIVRMGVRYLNRIVIPGDPVEMRRYFQLYAHIPPELAESHSSFMIGVEIPALHPEHRLTVTFGNAPAPEAGTQAFALDLYDVVSIDSESLDVADKYLGEGHDNIERAFESIITDDTRALFEEA